MVQYTNYSTRGVVSCYKSRTALRARINYNRELLDHATLQSDLTADFIKFFTTLIELTSVS